MHAGFGQLVLQVMAVVGLLLVQQRCEFLADQGQLLAGGEAVVAEFLNVRFHL